MRRIEGKHVAGWPYGRLTGVDAQPAPFPGKYPTRVLIRIGGNDLYLGKPSPNMIQKYRRAERNGSGHLEVWEFDRKQLIAYGELWVPSQTLESFSWSWREPTLLRYYHPWSQLAGTFFLPDFSQAFYVKRLKHQGQIHRVYSPFDKLKITAHLDPFKTWLRLHRIGEPEPTRTTNETR